MDDSAFGSHNKRGDFKPFARYEVAPLWHWPPQPKQVLAWLPSLLSPWNAFHMATALIWWFWVVPDMATMKTLDMQWPAYLLVVNWGAAALWYGAFEWRLYARRAQGTRFKYHHKFPGDQPSDVFWFKSQNIDNALRSFLIGVPCWTAVQVLVLWGYANGWGWWLSWEDHTVWLVVFALILAPAWHELHFFCIHWVLHQEPFYKWIHAIHHNSVNPSPISSLSMHPVEAFCYHAVALWHLVLPSNPVMALYQLHMASFGAINGHIGFDKMEWGREGLADSHAYLHYLHHKHFDVNFGGDGLIPLDQWLGSWHDGSPDGERRMQARYEAKLARINARKP